LNADNDALISLNPNPLVKYLGKLPKDFTKEDILKFVRDKEIRMINLCHVGEDGRLKTLNFPINNELHADGILDMGERVDGSSLFSFIEPSKSDLYIKPKMHKAFLNPFNTIPTLNVLCSYLDEDRKPLDIAPETILQKAKEKLLKDSGVELRVFCELEFYVIAKQEAEILYPSTPQKNYQESSPFVKFEQLRNEILATLVTVGVPVKYGHSEVGMVQENNGYVMEQHEIELQLESPEDIADNVAIAKWIIRNFGAKHGVTVSFAPKVAVGHAGTGMHVHITGMRDGVSIMTDDEGSLSRESRAMIGGILKFAPSLTAFGNTVPASYLRLVPQQEAPTEVYWGYKNRGALIRVPLGWRFEDRGKLEHMQTFEFRLPDSSANVHLLLAGILMAVDYGFTNKEKALQIADELLAEGANFRKENMKTLPKSCHESAKMLEKHRENYEKGGVFPKRVIDGTIEHLRQYNDANSLDTLQKDREKAKELIKKYLHCG
jgi:glutamine synthetase